jgi:hypothetical protein
MKRKSGVRKGSWIVPAGPTIPKAYNPDKTRRKGVKLSKKSKRYLRKLRHYRNVNRRKAARRKALQGRMANRILAEGKNINTEKISYKGWQKVFGKSVSFRAPGMFVSMLRRKAEIAGGSVNEFPLRNRLSQTCHNCGTIKKKSLSQRWHDCSCGVLGQRDLYSAFLAFCVVGNDLDLSQALKAWPGAEPLLRQAMSRCEKTMNGKLRFASFGLNRSQNGSLDEERVALNDSKDVVTSREVGESLEKFDGNALRTPGFSHGEVQLELLI